jgi:hypothetical protein
LRRLYGLTPADYDRMWADQGGLCPICSTALRPGRGGANVDHNHATGKVRAILCTPCNTALGKLREDPELFLHAVDYLKKHAA